MLSEKIKTLRTEKGMSQEELANELNVVRQTVSKWEQGLSLPDAEQLVCLAGVFGKTVGELVGENNKENCEENCEQPPEVSKKVKPQNSGKVWSIVLICVGSPVWISLIAAAFAVVISLFAAMWSCIASFWVAFAAFAAGTVGGVVYSGAFFSSNIPLAFSALSATLILAGLTIFAFFGCKLATKGAVKITKITVLWLKNLFTKKGGAAND